jgi:hypothetical protein
MSLRGILTGVLAILISAAGATDRLSAQPVNAIVTAAPTTVRLGQTLTLTSNSPNFFFTNNASVSFYPIGKGQKQQLLCRGSYYQSCSPSLSGRTLSVPIPLAPTGNPFLGQWRLVVRDSNLTGATLSAVIPTSITVVPTNFTGSSGPSASAPFVSGITPSCVWPWPTTITLSVDGTGFDPNSAQVIVSYIYFVGPHGRYRTDWHGKDSRIAANMQLPRSSDHLVFSVDLALIHQASNDHFGTFAGNYYVQVENANGKVSDGPMFFTVQPYHGPGMTQPV